MEIDSDSAAVVLTWLIDRRDNGYDLNDVIDELSNLPAGETEPVTS